MNDRVIKIHFLESALSLPEKLDVVSEQCPWLVMNIGDDHCNFSFVDLHSGIILLPLP